MSIAQDLIDEITALKRDASRWRALREMCGYFQCGEDETVTLYQDDATRSCFIKVGKTVHGTDGSTFESILDGIHKELSK